MKYTTTHKIHDYKCNKNLKKGTSWSLFLVLIFTGLFFSFVILGTFFKSAKN